MRNFATVCSFAALSVLMIAPSAQADIVYSQGFQGAIGSEWSSALTATAPLNASRRFLGQFGNDTVTLSLTGLPVHNTLTVSLEFIAILTWDGNVVFNSTNNLVGPDVWEIQADATTLLHSTFSNWANGESPNDPTVPQSFPDLFLAGNFEGRTGAAENNTLGFLNATVIQDSVYQLQFTFPHTSNNLSLSFSGIGLQGIGDESWGIDNVVVSSAFSVAAPEPASFALAFPLIAFALLRKRAR
jgi:hypothetical protein